MRAGAARAVAVEQGQGSTTWTRATDGLREINEVHLPRFETHAMIHARLSCELALAIPCGVQTAACSRHTGRQVTRRPGVQSLGLRHLKIRLMR